MKAVPLEPAIEERLRAIGSAELVVGIPSYNNAGTIGHVVRAVVAGLAKHFPGHRAVLVNSDGGSRDATREIVATADPRAGDDPGVAPARPAAPDRHPVPRPARQGQRAAHHLRDRRAARRARLRGGRLRPAQHHAGVDRAAARARAARGVRLRRAALPAAQVRRHDHELDRLPADPRALRSRGAPADRRRVRLLGPPRLALPGAAGLGERRRALRDRHLDDDHRARRRLPRVPVASWARRSTTPRTRART